MRVIPTKYNGYNFRSRTEARWAVFFDKLYIKYEYEKEGFILSDGTAYLPDFFLSDLQCWVEIKGEIPSKKEEEKCVKLHKDTNQRVVLIYGTPDPETAYFTTFDKYGERDYNPARYLATYLEDIISEEITSEYSDEFQTEEQLTREILEDLRKFDKINPIPTGVKKSRLNSSYNSIRKLITMDNEYTGDEYAFGQAKSARFGVIA